jgi:hypothetical protein
MCEAAPGGELSGSFRCDNEIKAFAKTQQFD